MYTFSAGVTVTASPCCFGKQSLFTLRITRKKIYNMCVKNAELLMSNRVIHVLGLNAVS